MYPSIIFSDMDGTFVATDKHIPSLNIELLDKLYDLGIEFVPCTGRPYKGLSQDLLAHKAVKHCVVANGASVVEVSTGKQIHSRPVDNDKVLGLYELVKDRPTTFDIFTHNTVYVEQARYDALPTFGVDEHNLKLIQAIRQPLDILVPEIVSTYKTVDRITVMYKEQQDYKCLVDAIAKDPCLHWVSSGSANLEISDVRASKGLALKWLCDYLDVDKSASVAFGDSLNDASMISEAGLGVAMSNASVDAKSVADVIALSNDEAGVANFVFNLL